MVPGQLSGATLLAVFVQASWVGREIIGELANCGFVVADPRVCDRFDLSYLTQRIDVRCGVAFSQDCARRIWLASARQRERDVGISLFETELARLRRTQIGELGNQLQCLRDVGWFAWQRIRHQLALGNAEKRGEPLHALQAVTTGLYAILQIPGGQENSPERDIRVFQK